MKRIGITQRVEFVDSYGERRDCLDQRWAPLLASQRLLALPLPNAVDDVASYLDELDLDGLLLSGGNDLATMLEASRAAPERDRFERAALDFAGANNLPVLAVCRGMQMLGEYYGAVLHPLQGHVGSRHTVTLAGEFLNWPAQLEINSFHNFGFDRTDLPNALVAIAAANDGTVEAFRHERLPHYGIMWHPEREPVIQVQDVALMQHLFGY